MKFSNKDESGGRTASRQAGWFRTLCVVGLAVITGTGTRWATAADTSRPQTFQVVVYGATPAGVCAAVAARREGASVVLVEPSNLVGGMMSSGLSFSDSNQMARECLRGLFEEFHERVEQKYLERGVDLPYAVQEKDARHWTYEPHVAEQAFGEMLREAGVSLLLNEAIASVARHGTRIEAMVTHTDRNVAGEVFIDASYEGDLMARAGVEYRVGREPADEFDEPLAGLQFPKPLVEVSPLDDRGRLLPLVTGHDGRNRAGGDGMVMTYSYRLCLTDVPANRVAIDRPEDYDPQQFELFRRYYAKHPDAELPIDLYPIPGGKFDGNNGIAKQLSLGLVGGSWDWPEASMDEREAILQRHKSYTHGLLWFLAHDEAVPASIRKRARTLGLARDEFQSNGHWPPMLYIREARRMVGEYFMTEDDIERRVEKPDSIAIGSFPCDSHDCQRIARNGGFINEGTIYPRHIAGRPIGQPYTVPYRSITPKAEECDNLLVPVCASATHVAMCSLRVEPTWMVLGESSGIAAAYAARQDVAVQAVPYDALKARLTARGVVVSLDVVRRD